MKTLLLFLLLLLPISAQELDIAFSHEQKKDSNPKPPPLSTPTPPIPPEIYGVELPSENSAIIYVVDKSCSMYAGAAPFVNYQSQYVSGNRLDRAKSELVSSISGLAPNFIFEVIAYSCGTSFCFNELRANSPANQATAFGWILSLQPSGGTGTGPAMAAALLKSLYAECLSYVLITDGSPNCLSGFGFSSSGWPTHLAVINGANVKAATINVIAVNPGSPSMIDFCQSVAESNGPGQFIIVGN